MHKKKVEHIHILGICGTFMGSLAVLAKALGYRVTGSDQNVYPPMSTQLQAAGIELTVGYDSEQLKPAPDMVIVGNAMSRGNPAVEYLLNHGLRYCSGPQWLSENLLADRWVLAVAGTHGKTTTATMLAWILEQAGMAPGFLIGGVPLNFDRSARLGETDFFVIEADEYDTAFFDKRSKFVHYHPRTLIMNNLEYDHADIFPDLAAIQQQFHHLLKIVPSHGQVILPNNQPSLDEVIERGCWTPVVHTSLEGESEWQAVLLQEDGGAFQVLHHQQLVGEVNWAMTGRHNVSNGLAAIAAAHHVGVIPECSIEALSCFGGVKRRMELLATVAGVSVYDDFAHHPTAIETTLQGLRARIGDAKLLAVIEPRSNTMKSGVHQHRLADSVAQADWVAWMDSGSLDWSLADMLSNSAVNSACFNHLDAMVAAICEQVTEGAHVVIMSNGGFGGVHQKLIEALKGRFNV